MRHNTLRKSMLLHNNCYTKSIILFDVEVIIALELCVKEDGQNCAFDPPLRDFRLKRLLACHVSELNLKVRSNSLDFLLLAQKL